MINKFLCKWSESLFVHFVQVYDLSLLYVTVKDICNGKDRLYNHIKFAMDGHVFAESWTNFADKRKEFFKLKLCESMQKLTTDSVEPE